MNHAAATKRESRADERLRGQTFTINQAAGSSCTFTLMTSSASIPAGGGTGSFSFMASGPSCAWTATPSRSLVCVTSATSGTGSGSVSFSLAANAGAARSGTVTLGGQTFTINQDAASDCTFTLATSSANIPVGGGTGAFSFHGIGTELCVDYNSQPVFHLDHLGNFRNRQPLVSFSVAANAGAARSGSITVGGQTFTITQAGTSARTFMLTPTSVSSPIAGGTGSFGITASGQSCAWSAASNNSFITVTSRPNGTGNGTGNYTVAANSGAPRSGTVTAVGLTFTVNQPASVTLPVGGVSAVSVTVVPKTDGFADDANSVVAGDPPRARPIGKSASRTGRHVRRTLANRICAGIVGPQIEKRD
jgi:hypothetical protein